MKKLATIILMSLLWCVNAAADNFIPKHEIRAVWLTTLGGLDWPKTYAVSKYSAEKQKRELTNILDKLQDAGINCILFQVRTRSAVLYPSKIEPWASCLSGHHGKGPGYDALAFATEECHKRGMEIHAWVTTIPAGAWNSKECRELRKKLPRAVKRDGANGYMDPGRRETADYLSDLCGEIATNYDVDGIHLDYIRYPETIRPKIPAFKARENITNIVRDIYFRVKSIKPWIKMSCSPIGKYSDLSRFSSRGWNARDRVYQDAQKWMRDDIMDIIFPMMYFRNDNYYPFLIDWADNKHSGSVAAGLGVYMLSPREGNWSLDDITRQMYVARQYETGYAFFRSKFLTDDIKGIYSFTKDIFNLYPALMPETKCHNVEKPSAPKHIDVKYSGDYYIINWDEGRWFDRSPYCSYNVYASHEYPVNTNDVRNLIRYRTRERHAAVKRCSSPLYFAVTTSDRYSRESHAVQQDIHTAATENDFIKCKNGFVELDDIDADVEFIVVESLQGNIIATLKYNKNGINMKSLEPGFYLLRTLNGRGISHRIGVMLKKQ